MMSEEVYNKVTELQDLVTEQSNIIADIIEQLDQLAQIWEKDI